MEKADIIFYKDEGRALQDAEVTQVASGLQFSEGALWHPDGYLLFSDTPANRIYQLFPDTKPRVYLDNSGFTKTDGSMLSDQVGSNGLAFDEDGDLLVCQHGDHAIARLGSGKKLEILADSYEGKPFNSPNDIVCGPDGAIYFTDPPYGLKDQVLHPETFQTAAGVYRFYKGEITRMSEDLRYPNGICFSPSGEFMYVGSNHPDEAIIWKYKVSGGKIKQQSILINQNADGIKTDKKGNLWMATEEGLMVVSPGGIKLALFRMDETPTNLNWVGNDYSQLYVTARSAVYHIKNLH